VLQALVEDCKQAISQIDLLSAQDRQILLYDWNLTDAPYAADKTLFQLFEEQVQRVPDNIALVFENQQLSYLQLNERANQLAHAIRHEYQIRCGETIKPDTLIALYLDRSLEMVISILAVLKAGGAYVPIAPEHPQERVKFLLEDTQAPLLLAQRHYRARLTSWIGHTVNNTANILYVDQLEAGLPVGNPEPINTATDLAYVIYTSGTTGQPKGVLIEQRSVANMIQNQARAFDFDARDATLCVASYIFDASVEQMFLPLLNGAKLIVTDQQTILSPASVESLIDKHQVTHLDATPSYLLGVLHVLTKPYCLRLVVSGGEACVPALTEKWGKLLMNTYGPTEAAVTSVLCLDSDLIEAGCIGKPIANTRAYVLDSFLQPLPVGVTGELYIGGVGVGRGYLNRAELTAERFIANPFATEMDKRQGYTKLYKTGDLVRWRQDGNLEYVGRNDLQVKIRGYRIELGEIESALAALPEIKQAVVIDREQGGNKYLAAYMVAAADASIDAESLRTSLLSQLPEYMVPSTFTELDAIPLTINGKVDRRALPEPHWIAEDQYTAPRTELETRLCAVWQGVLGLERVGIHDNFFRIGGNSIASIQLIAKMRKAGLNVQVLDLFNAPTIAQLVAKADAGGLSAIQATSIPQRNGRDDVPGSFVIQNWWRDMGCGKTSLIAGGANLAIAGIYDAAAVRSCIEYLYQRHGILRSIPYKKEDAIWFRVSDSCVPEINVIDLSGLDDPTQELVKLRGRINDIRYLIGDALVHEVNHPLCKVTVAVCRTEFYVQFSIDHMISDGFSATVLMEEFRQLYEQAINHRPVVLPDKPIDYPDYLAWLHYDYPGSELERQATEFWRKQSGEYRPARMAHDFRDIKKTKGTWKKIAFLLEKDISQGVDLLAVQSGATQSNTLFALISDFVCRKLAIDRPALGIILSGRALQEVEGLVGSLADLVFVPSPISRDMGVVAAVQSTQQLIAAAMNYQQINFREYMPMGISPEDRREVPRIESSPFAFSYDSFYQVTPGYVQQLERGDISSAVAGVGLLHYIWIRFARADNRFACFLEYEGCYYAEATMESMVNEIRNHLSRTLGHKSRTPEAA
jgi:amino acid adenylation domain-containing protein